MKRTVTVRNSNVIKLRDYDVKKALDNNEKMEVTYQNEVMTLSPEELVSKRIATGAPIKSQFNDKSYTLFSYRWVSDEMDY
jgi:hypothetical protein